VATGPPEAIAASPQSITGCYLAAYLAAAGERESEA